MCNSIENEYLKFYDESKDFKGITTEIIDSEIGLLIKDVHKLFGTYVYNDSIEFGKPCKLLDGQTIEYYINSNNADVPISDIKNELVNYIAQKFDEQTKRYLTCIKIMDDAIMQLRKSNND